MSLTWRAAVAGVEAATAVCAALNFSYFLARLLAARPERATRRVAVFVLALLSLGALVEAVFVLSAVALDQAAVFASAQWALARALPLAGTACVSALVMRALSERR